MSEGMAYMDGPVRVLLVDDDQVDRMAIERFVRTEGLPYEMESASSISEARQHLKNSRFDVAILDYQLSDGTGLELLKEIEDVACIILTGSGNEVVAAEALRAGAYDYLIKDSDRDYLRMLGATVQNAVERKRKDDTLRNVYIELEEKMAAQNLKLQMANKALQEAKEKYQLLYDNAPDMSVSVVPGTRLVVECNLTVTERLGFSRNEIIGQPVFKLYHPDCLDRVQEALEEFVSTGRVRNVELQLQSKEGEKIDVSLNVLSVRDDKGDILYSTSVWHDITDRKQAEREINKLNEGLEQRVLERTSELQLANLHLQQEIGERRAAVKAAETANRAKSEILANTSHEIRTPMNAIIGMAELFSSTRLTDRQQHYLDAIKGSAETLLDLLNDILDLSKVEAGKLSLEVGDFGLRETLDNVIKAQAQDARKKGLELISEVEPGLPDAVIGDSLRLRQIVTQPGEQCHKVHRSGQGGGDGGRGNSWRE